MSKRRPSSPSNADAKQNVSPLYDDALPVTLQSLGRVHLHKQHIKPHTGNAPLSPYIIHLSRHEMDEKTEQQEAAVKTLFMEDLSLEVEPAHADIVIDDQECRKQLRELDLQIEQKRPRVEKNVSPRSVQEAAPATLVPIAPIARQELETLLVQEALENEQDDTKEPPVLEEILELTEVQDSETKAFVWPRFRVPSFSFPRLGKAHHRAIASFTILSFALVMPLSAMKGFYQASTSEESIITTGSQATEDFLQGASALEDDRYNLAEVNFERASAAFSDAQEELEGFSSSVALVAKLVPQTDKTYTTVTSLLTAGEELSTAAAQISQAADQLLDESDSVSIVTKLRILSTYIQNALPHMKTAEEAVERIDLSVIPEEQQDTVSRLINETPRLDTAMEEFLTFSDALIRILGEDEKMRYLVVFQNNTELRATGGFIGSFAEMDVYQGKITNIFIPPGGTYDLQGQLSAFVKSPEPLALINPRWEFHDANWFPDFPTSAKKLLWFYEKAGGPTVDGVIAINASVIPDLLALTGPIEMESYDRVIDSENFLFETQKIVEYEYEQYQESGNREEDAPKQFIADLAPKLLEHIETSDAENMLAMMQVLGTALIQKDAMLYFEDNELEAQMETLGWSGSMKQTSGDSLMIVDSNLGGRKTDNVIEQQADLRVDIAEDGTITNTLTITKIHHGLTTNLFEGENNVDYLRVYVPQGSELISATRVGGPFEVPELELFEASDLPLSPDEDLGLAMQNIDKDAISGTDIWDEHGRTVFGNWIQTKPGEVETVEFVYTLPFQLEMPPENPSLLEIAKARIGFKTLTPYTLLLQKQPGVEDRTTHVSITLPETSEVVWSSNTGSDGANDIVLTNEKDAFLRMLIEHGW